jgi:8-oxo-dGTP pyrophosphatase MutT (NUDIX family)
MPYRQTGLMPSPRTEAAQPEIVVAAVAFVRDGQVLTVRKRGTERFMLVGGKLEPGEDARDAAIRESAEEVGVAVVDPELVGEYESETANEPGHVLRSTVFVAPLTSEPVAAGEIAELRWVDLLRAAAGEYDDLAPMLEHHVLPVLLAQDAADEQAAGGAR